MKKNKRKIPVDTLKTLLARSGNQCAFPECSHPIFDDNNIFIAQLCHIEAVSPNGQRYNPNKTAEETNSYENLLFLCYRHHKVTDNVKLYPVEKLKNIKINHESKFKEVSYDYPQEVLTNLENEIENFWIKVDKLQSEHIIPELAVPINTKNDVLSLIREANEHLNNLTEMNMLLMDDIKEKYFEYICLSIPNLLTKISTAVDQIEIIYLEEQILKKPDSEDLKNRLKEARSAFEDIAMYRALSD